MVGIVKRHAGLAVEELGPAHLHGTGIKETRGIVADAQVAAAVSAGPESGEETGGGIGKPSGHQGFRVLPVDEPLLAADDTKEHLGQGPIGGIIDLDGEFDAAFDDADMIPDADVESLPGIAQLFVNAGHAVRRFDDTDVLLLPAYEIARLGPRTGQEEPEIFSQPGLPDDFDAGILPVQTFEVAGLFGEPDGADGSLDHPNLRRGPGPARGGKSPQRC